MSGADALSDGIALKEEDSSNDDVSPPVDKTAPAGENPLIDQPVDANGTSKSEIPAQNALAVWVDALMKEDSPDMPPPVDTTTARADENSVSSRPANALSDGMVSVKKEESPKKDVSSPVDKTLQAALADENSLINRLVKANGSSKSEAFKIFCDDIETEGLDDDEEETKGIVDKGSAGAVNVRNGKRPSRIVTKPRKFDDYVEIPKKKWRSISNKTVKNESFSTDSIAEFHFADDNLDQSLIEDDSDQSGDEISAVTSKVKGGRPAKIVISKQSKNKKSKGNKKKKMGVLRRNNTKLACPECKFGTFSVISWMYHLRHSHSTTPKLAGLVLHCECGQDSYSHVHSLSCKIGKFTVVRKGNRPIKRLDDEKETPQCVYCVKYPNTIGTYYAHLVREHKATLIRKKIYLKCNCGKIVTSGNDLKGHGKTCDGRQYTLHKCAKR